MDDVALVQSLKPRLLQLRSEEMVARRALNAELRATKHRRISRSSTGFTHFEENVALSLVVKQNTSLRGRDILDSHARSLTSQILGA